MPVAYLKKGVNYVYHGNIKATQGDTGHAQPDMVTEVYSHILDEDRKVNAQRFEAGFYSRPDLRGAEKHFGKRPVVNPQQSFFNC